MFPVQNIFYGPIEVLPMKNGRWSVPELSKIRDAFGRNKMLFDRNKLFQAFYASQQSNE